MSERNHNAVSRMFFIIFLIDLDILMGCYSGLFGLLVTGLVWSVSFQLLTISPARASLIKISS